MPPVLVFSHARRSGLTDYEARQLARNLTQDNEGPTQVAFKSFVFVAGLSALGLIASFVF